MIEPLAWFSVGLIALIGGAELLVRHVSNLALRLGVSKLVIALTVVALGTSAPELAVSIQAGVDGQTDLMLGNIVGSNISNTLFILGISALFIPLKVHKSLIKSDVPIMIGVTLLIYILALNGNIGFWECLLLITFLSIYLFLLSIQKGHIGIPGVEENESERENVVVSILLSLAGFALLIIGARWLISSSLIFAETAGVSELVIGLTVVAIGTSLPEIVVALVAAFRRERDIAVGSVVGSNILNFLAVLGFSGLFTDGTIPVGEALLNFDLLVLIGASVLCIPIFYTGHRIVRWEGGMFLLFYFAYLFYLFLSSTDHRFLDVFVNMMLFFVFPVTIIAVLYHSISEWRWRMQYAGLFKPKRKED